MAEPKTPVSIHCRRASVLDVDTITDFNQRLAQETEDTKLDVAILREGVAQGIRNFPEAQYFVAESEGRVIGQLMVTREWSDWRNGWMLWLQSVYVDQQSRRHGVFRRLLDHAMRHVEVDGAAVGLRLYVERENESAIAVYDQLGFKDAGCRLLEIVPLPR